MSGVKFLYVIKIMPRAAELCLLGRNQIQRGRWAIFNRKLRQEQIDKKIRKSDLDADRLRFFTVDITDKPSILSALSLIEEEWDTPDVLINNTGAREYHGRILRTCRVT